MPAAWIEDIWIVSRNLISPVYKIDRHMLCSDMFDVGIVIVLDNYECKALCELHLNRIWYFIYNAYGHMTGIYWHESAM